jgi:hypothetical protein
MNRDSTMPPMPEHHANPGVTEDQDDGARAHLEESIVNLAEQIRQGNVKYLQGQKMLRVAAGAERRRERQ